jgi:SAM-dependent methyltransferase
MIADGYVDVPFNVKSLDTYHIRRAILDALTENLHYFQGTLLDVGCGKMPYKQYIQSNTSIIDYIGLDIETALTYDVNVRPDYRWDGKKMPFADAQFDTVLATEVLEHCHHPLTVVKEIHRVLKKDGVFFFTVPFLWNLHEVPHDEYRYTPFALKKIFEDAGFHDIKIIPTGGWHASLAQMLGLWVRRAPMKNSKRKILSFLLKQLMSYLIKKDKGSNIDFSKGPMITGLYGVVKKNNVSE